MARDTQRQRLYAAETEAETRLLREERQGRPDGKAVPPRNPRLADDDVLPLVWRIARSRNLGAVSVEFVPDRSHADVRRNPNVLVLPPWARCPLVIIHELAHLLVDPIFPSHGAEFAAAELSLLKEFAPEPVADYFREAFAQEEIQYEPSPKQALRFLSYCSRRGGGAIVAITDDAAFYAGDMLEYNRKEGYVELDQGRRIDLETLRYATWAS